MPGLLLHSPADIIRRLLIQMGLGSDPPTTPWPVFCAREPSTPDNCITVYDTAGRDFGYTQPDMERVEYHGFSVRVRATTHQAGYAKARAIAIAIDEQANAQGVTIDGTAYCVDDASRTSDVLALGKETPESKRSLFIVNGLTYLFAT